MDFWPKQMHDSIQAALWRTKDMGYLHKAYAVLNALESLPGARVVDGHLVVPIEFSEQEIENLTRAGADLTGRQPSR